MRGHRLDPVLDTQLIFNDTIGNQYTFANANLTTSLFISLSLFDLSYTFLTMSIPIQTTPPDSRTAYIIDQLEGERVTIPGSKGVFRILASSKQTNGGIAVFSSGAVLSDAPGFHWHAEAHDVFLVTKGHLKLWNGDKCRIMGPGDFAYVPPVRVLQRPRQSGILLILNDNRQ